VPVLSVKRFGLDPAAFEELQQAALAAHGDAQIAAGFGAGVTRRPLNCILDEAARVGPGQSLAVQVAGVAEGDRPAPSHLRAGDNRLTVPSAPANRHGKRAVAEDTKRSRHTWRGDFRHPFEQDRDVIDALRSNTAAE
jgi:hypothetical protein